MQHRPAGGSGARDRGQIIILAALVIAVIFVGLALVLNSGIYAENLSSRETTDTDGALSFTLATDEAIAEAYERTNRNDSATAAAARGTFNETVDRWEFAQQRRGAEQGIGIDIERTPHVGWRLEQSGDRNFTNASDVTDWKLAGGTADVAGFQLNVTRSSLHSPSTTAEVSNAYRVEVDGTNAGDWDLYVFENNSDVVVHAGDPASYSSLSDLLNDGSNTCREAVSRAVVDLRNETLAGTDCAALNFSDDEDGAVDVHYVNGDQASGTYTLVVNGSGAAQGSNFDGPTGADPTATAVVYSASWASHYGRAELAHDRRGWYMVRGETYDG